MSAFIWLIYLFVWVYCRPSFFEVGGGGLTIVWPMRTREFRRERIAGVRRISKQEVGRVLRLFGAGGLWGVFGLCRSKSLGFFDGYIAHPAFLVLIEFHGRRPLLLSPDRPDEFVADLKAMLAT